MRFSAFSALALASLAALVAAAGVRAPQDARVAQGVLAAAFEAESVSAPAAAAASPLRVTVVSQNIAQKSVSKTHEETKELLYKANVECCDSDLIIIATQENKISVSPPYDGGMADNVFGACQMQCAHSEGYAALFNPVQTLHYASLSTDFHQTLSVYVRKTSGVSPLAAMYSHYLVYHGAKGYIVAPLKLDDTHALAVVSAHLPMNSKDKADQGYGAQTRFEAMDAIRHNIAGQTWFNAQTTVLFTGDLNFRVTTGDVEQLQLGIPTLKTASFNAHMAPSTATPAAAAVASWGWHEPRLPTYYTCRFGKRSTLEGQANKAARTLDLFDECRSGRSAPAAGSHVGALSPKFAIDAPEPNHFEPPSGYFSLVKASKGADCAVAPPAAMNAVTKGLQRECHCGSMEKPRPMSFCDRVLTRQGRDTSVAYVAYESVPIVPNSDHNALAATLTLTWPVAAAPAAVAGEAHAAAPAAIQPGLPDHDVEMAEDVAHHISEPAVADVMAATAPAGADTVIPASENE